jgi:hypothetical protein
VAQPGDEKLERTWTGRFHWERVKMMRLSSGATRDQRL